jgi:hypothetical protein
MSENQLNAWLTFIHVEAFFYQVFHSKINEQIIGCLNVYLALSTRIGERNLNLIEDLHHE